MGVCRNTEHKPFLIFGCGESLILVSLALGLLFPAITLCLHSSTLNEGSRNNGNGFGSPFTTYLEITMFNWTNCHELFNPNVKPLFTELGPYVFLEHSTRTNITWNGNGTVTFNLMRTWKFIPNMSNGSLDDEITNLNVVSAGVAYSVRNESPLIKIGTNIILNARGGSRFVTKKVGEMLFDGYNDPFLDFINGSGSSNFLPLTKFGWFVERNGSWSHDGQFNVNTGDMDIFQMGTLHSWNGESTTRFYSDGCSKINGTIGQLWPPKLNPQKDLTIFIPDICRSISLAPEYVAGCLEGSKWIGDHRVFDNGENYPPNTCFCTGSECPDLKPGVLNVSSCHLDLPIFASYPHFYLADPSFRDAIDGLNATKENHEFSILLEPNTGVPLQINARLQINVLLQPISRITLYENVPHVMTPMFWVTQKVRHVSQG